METEFEEVLVKVGDFGSYQKMLIITILLPTSLIMPCYSMNLFFMAITPDHWCKVPELMTTNLSIAERQKLIRPASDPKCKMYGVNYTELIVSSNWTIPQDTNTMFCDQGWEYDETDFDSTAATKWDMVCNNSYYVSVTLSTADIATLIGTPLYGGLADKFGRKPIFFLTVFVATVTGLSAVLVSNMVIFLIMKTMDQTVMPALYQMLHVIRMLPTALSSLEEACSSAQEDYYQVVELVGPDKRSFVNGAENMLWTVGLCLVPLVAWLARGWVNLGITVACLSVIFLTFLKTLPESPRWLASQGRYDEAAAIMLHIAERNGKNIKRDELLADLKKIGKRARQQKEEEGSTKKFYTYISKYPQLRKKFLIISLCWAAYSTAYYGLHLNVTNLSGNQFINFFLLAAVEFPGLLSSWYFMEKFGRRWWSVFCLILTGLACLIPSFIPAEMTAGNTVASIIGKLGASAGYLVMYQQASELFPTVIRTAGIGFSTIASGVFGIAVPYVVYLGKYGKFIPFLIFSCLCLTASIATAFLPETLNENLPQTLDDAEEFGKDQKFFSCHRRKRPVCHEEKHLENVIQMN